MAITLSVLVLGVGPKPALASTLRSMMCQTTGCYSRTADAIWVHERNDAWQIELGANYFGMDLSEFVVKADLAPEGTGADFATFEIKKKYCKATRADLGELYCNGPVDWAYINLRLKERFTEGQGSTYTRAVVYSPDEKPWHLDLRALPDRGGEKRWAISLASGNASHDFSDVRLGFCHFNN